MEPYGRSTDPPFWQSVSFLGFMGFVVVMGLGFTGVFASVGDLMRSETSSYDAAPVCASAADLSSCRFDGKGRIAGTSTHSGNLTVDVTFDQLNRNVTAELDPAYASQWRTWEVDSVVDAELWHGRVVKVAGLKTRENPDTYPAISYTMATIVFGAITVVLTAILAWLLLLYRQVLKARKQILSGGVPGTQVLALTPDMEGLLGREAARVKNPRQTVLLITACASAAAAVLTGIYKFEGLRPDLVIAFIWAACLGVGILIAWMWVHDVWLERRDLAGRVFVRATGPFSVHVIRTKRMGNKVVIALGGRALSGVFSRVDRLRGPGAQPLESIESGSGTVDYLPLSGMLIGIRDVSGAPLWSRFAGPVQSATP